MPRPRARRARLDAALQRSAITAFPAAVGRKYADDQAGSLAAVITYHGFLAIFPLTVVLTTILGIVVDDRPDLQRKILDSALADFPVVGTEIRRNVAALASNSALRLAIALAVTFWGALGVAHALQHAMAHVWNVPQTHRPRLLARLARSLALCAVLGLGVAASTAGSALASVGHGAVGPAIGIAASLAAAFGLFVLAFRVLTPLPLDTRSVAPGAAFGAVTWTLLQLLGTYLVTQRLRDLDDLYGTFAAVLGLLWWIYLSAQMTVIAAEINVVRARHLWPRSLFGSDQSSEPADRAALRTLAEEQQRTPDEAINVRFEPDDDRQDDRRGDQSRGGPRPTAGSGTPG